MEKYCHVYYIHFEITGYPCNLIGSQQCDLLLNRTIFVLYRIISVSNTKWDVKALLFRLFNSAASWSIKYSISTDCILWFQNGCNKVVIELRVVQVWSEIILVISNRTRAARSFDFEITRMISDQISLHFKLLHVSYSLTIYACCAQTDNHFTATAY